ncbi:unnamed protein product [Dimorphilus gyrociliatus]|uniref:CEP63/Deup1 N-terminal domain-containing protein n=1 Tax=Dimorphilus gyrociliatus TaxID=2664684 RepID=A0A7I8VR63_9ANNE|nr:unnamed protein product [Dimorphilus gyrociliatus]
MSDVSSMWEKLQRHGSKKYISDCEAEIRELIRQVDIMVEHERQKWNAEKTKLTAKCSQLQNELERSLKELTEFKRSSAEVERSKRQLSYSCERQLGSLRAEVDTMKKEYDKLHRKHEKHTKEMKREVTRLKTELESSKNEVSRLTNKTSDMRTRNKSIEEEKQKMENEFQTLLSDNKTLRDTSELLQGQIANYQNELEKRREIIEKSESNFKNQLCQLEIQLDGARDTINCQEVEISKLRTILEDANGRQKSTSDNQDKILMDLYETQQSKQKLQIIKLELESVLKLKDEQLVKNDYHIKQLEENIQELSSAVEEKDNLLHSLRESNESDVSSQIHSLQNKLKALKSETKQNKLREKEAQEELSAAKKLINDKSLECDQMRSNIRKQYEQSLYLTREKYENEIKILEDKITLLTADFERVEKTNTYLSTQVQFFQARKEESESELEKRTRELQSLEEEKIIPSIKDETQDKLKELKITYESSVTSLEEQNRTLRTKIRDLESQINDLQNRENEAEQILVAKEEMNKKLELVKLQDTKHLATVEKLADERVEHYKQRYLSNSKAYEATIDSLKMEVALYKHKLEQQETEAKRLHEENSAMSSFLNKYEDHMQYEATNKSWFMPDDDDVSLLEEQAVESFIEDHRNRTKQLENKLDTHIHELKQSLDYEL